MERKVDDNKLYNKWDNHIMISTNGDEINVICNTELQMDKVVKRLSTDTCLLSGYEEWDEGKDKKWILKFIVCDDEYEFIPEYN
jgi:hypothetical protein|tara:strand:- start:77 stop:328 length:252 start_codon:yes stop_codon:yes gene_type:complete